MPRRLKTLGAVNRCWGMLGYASTRLVLGGLLVVAAAGVFGGEPGCEPAPPGYRVYPIGWIRKAGGSTRIEIDERYRDAMLGVEALSEIWVLYWFDRNDTPEQRSILQVHPRRDARAPLRGVFATRAPVRPNLIALSRVKILAVRENVIEIEDIDAYADTPVLDLKP